VPSADTIRVWTLGGREVEQQKKIEELALRRRKEELNDLPFESFS